VIKGFADAATKEIFEGYAPKGLPKEIWSAARRKLRYLDAAVKLNDLQVPPGNKLHPLTHNRAGQHAIWINDKYRICFRWQDDGVDEVEIADYH
jgi:proteic killer suppression protein